MYILQAKTLGVIILALFGLQGMFVLFSAGSLRFQRPAGGLIPWVYNLLNLSATLLFTPLAAVSLIAGWAPPLTWIGLFGGSSLAATAAGWLGLASYAMGILLMCWARTVLGRSFRLGAVPPAARDRLVVSGPFHLVRHPMYSAVILTVVGLGLALRSFVFLSLALGVLWTYSTLLSTEEAQLREAYGEEYKVYCQKTRRLIPFLY